MSKKTQATAQNLYQIRMDLVLRFTIIRKFPIFFIRIHFTRIIDSSKKTFNLLLINLLIFNNVHKISNIFVFIFLVFDYVLLTYSAEVFLIFYFYILSFIRQFTTFLTVTISCLFFQSLLISFVISLALLIFKTKKRLKLPISYNDSLVCLK